METSISTTRKGGIEGRLKGLPFSHIKDSVLGKKYELSLVFIGRSKSRSMNRKFRGKDKPTNVLSFPLSAESGEIFIDLDTAEKEAEKFDMAFKNFVLYLFIHGILHLKGMEHGDTMEKREKALIKRFKI